MYQDEAGFGRISKLGACWSPKNYRPNISSHHIQEFRYCYGAADAHTGESFFIIAGGFNTAWMSVIDKLQEIIQGLDSETLKSIVHRKWICSDFEIK